MDFNKVGELVISLLTQFGFKLLGGIVLWIVSQKLINLVENLIRRSFKGQATSLLQSKIDATMINYLTAFIGITLRIILVVALLGFFGIPTTTFAALLAAAGIAIGAAWGGMLSNFAAGVFLIIFRPFQVGDFIAAAGVTGRVQEIGLFATTLSTPDHVVAIVGNNKLLGENIHNYSINAYRRVDLTAQLTSGMNLRLAIALLQERLTQVPHVLLDPAPVVDILEFNTTGAVLAVRPCCHNDYYWQVHFATNQVIYEIFTPPPESQDYVIETEEV